jgi:hypothetical protein
MRDEGVAVRGRVIHKWSWEVRLKEKWWQKQVLFVGLVWGLQLGDGLLDNWCHSLIRASSIAGLTYWWRDLCLSAIELLFVSTDPLMEQLDEWSRQRATKWLFTQRRKWGEWVLLHALRFLPCSIRVQWRSPVLNSTNTFQLRCSQGLVPGPCE